MKEILGLNSLEYFNVKMTACMFTLMTILNVLTCAVR